MNNLSREIRKEEPDPKLDQEQRGLPRMKDPRGTPSVNGPLPTQKGAIAQSPSQQHRPSIKSEGPTSRTTGSKRGGWSKGICENSNLNSNSRGGSKGERERGGVKLSQQPRMYDFFGRSEIRKRHSCISPPVDKEKPPGDQMNFQRRK